MRRGDQNRHQVAPRSDKCQSSYALLVRELSIGRFFDEMGVLNEVFDEVSMKLEQEPRTKDQQPRTNTLSSRRLDAKRHYVI